MPLGHTHTHNTHTHNTPHTHTHRHDTHTHTHTHTHTTHTRDLKNIFLETFFIYTTQEHPLTTVHVFVLNIFVVVLEPMLHASTRAPILRFGYLINAILGLILVSLGAQIGLFGVLFDSQGAGTLQVRTQCKKRPKMDPIWELILEPFSSKL